MLVAYPGSKAGSRARKPMTVFASELTPLTTMIRSLRTKALWSSHSVTCPKDPMPKCSKRLHRSEISAEFKKMNG